MKKEENDLLKIGENVTITLNSQEDFTGKVIMRSGIGDEDNYDPSNESITIEHKDGCTLETSFSNIKSVR